MTIRVHNRLPTNTSIHWHGLRVPNASDGTPASQVPVEPGASYDYVFTASDAGTFWYHPHVHGDVQIERGLYAPIVDNYFWGDDFLTFFRLRDLTPFEYLMRPQGSHLYAATGAVFWAGDRAFELGLHDSH